MGYDATTRDRELEIEGRHFEAALAALHDAAREHDGGHVGWTKLSDVLGCDTLKLALAEFGWEAVLDGDDPPNLVDLWWEWEKMGDEQEVLWAALAPFIAPGSYIEIVGNGGEDLWRWYFDGETCVKQWWAAVVWPESE